MRYLKKRTYVIKTVQRLCAAVLMAALLAGGVYAAAAEEDDNALEQEILEEQSRSSEAKGIEEQLKKHAGEELDELIEGYESDGIIEDAAKGKFSLDIPNLLNKTAQYLFRELYQNLHILIKLIALTVVCAVLKNLQASFMSQNVGELAFYACYIVVVSVIVAGFHTAMSLSSSIIDGMVNFMYATIPVLITLLVSGGNLTSGGIFQPIMIMIVEVSATIIKNFFIPMIFLSTILSIVNNISDRIQLSRLAGMLRQIAVWGLGFILTVFIGAVSIQGTLGAVVDGVTSKTAKFALNAFVPVAGKYLADAADTVIGCTLLIKNAAGLAVMIGIIGVCLVPLLKIVAIIALYKLTCVIVEPIAEKRITACINDVSNSMLFVLGVTAAVAIMFLITVTVMISAGNISTMIR